MLSIAKISCFKNDSLSNYELDTNLFNESIFKLCTECKMLVHDFSKIFCCCGKKLDYMEVSDVDALCSWLNYSSLNDKKEDPKDPMEDPNEEFFDNEGLLMDENHCCGNNSDCSDCIDCNERKWDNDIDSDDNSTDIGLDKEYYRAIYTNDLLEDYTGYDEECDEECDDECDDECDSVS
jgi:hypothetical protein